MGDEFVRFLVLSGPRTGSTLLTSSLNSHPDVVCFSEVFNFTSDYIPFNVEGYDNYNLRDLKWRGEDPYGFLEERVFSGHPKSVRAAGLKILYGQFFGFAGLQEAIVADSDIRIVRLKRRNILRTLVSQKRAEQTGLYWQNAKPRPLVPRLVRAARHPLRAADSVRARLRRPKPSLDVKVHISSQELFKYIIKIQRLSDRYDDLFRAHPLITLYYEDLADRPQAVFRRVQLFLDLNPRELEIALERQNPQPPSELIANYSELRDAFRDSEHAAMFE